MKTKTNNYYIFFGKRTSDSCSSCIKFHEKWNFDNFTKSTNLQRLIEKFFCALSKNYKGKTFRFNNPSFCVNIDEKYTLGLFRYLACGRKPGPNFHNKVTWNSVMGTLLVPNFAILVSQLFAGFYFRDFKRQKKRLKSRWKVGWYTSFHNKFQLLFHGTHPDFETLS